MTELFTAQHRIQISSHPHEIIGGKYLIFNTVESLISSVYQLLTHPESETNQYFIYPNPEEIPQLFMDRFETIVAAGGLVRKGSESLWIYRNGKWDLPKGRIEKGETLAECAVREVEEECGVQAKILRTLPTTLHLYLNNRRELICKQSFWFEMQCVNDEYMQPQKSEGITDVRWFEDANIHKILPQTFLSIKDFWMGYKV